MKKKNHPQLKQQWDQTVSSGKWQRIIETGAEQLAVPVEGTMIDQMMFHARELMRWNEKFNITAIVAPDEVAVKHFIDSIAVAPHVPEGVRVIDLGSGGGFPGIPLKIVNPSIELVMVDSSRKRVSFLNHIGRTLQSKWGLDGMKALHVRAEVLGKEDGYANEFDVVVSRAFTSLLSFTEMALPFLNDKGVVLAMKGKVEEHELDEMESHRKNNGISIQRELFSYTLPFELHRRNIVKVMKG